MNAITIDTLHFANRLKSVGFTDEQAQVITELQLSANDSTLEQVKHDYHLDEVATKHDIELLRADTGRMIAETNQRIAESRADLTRWIIGAGFFQTVLVIGVLLKIAHLI